MGLIHGAQFHAAIARRGCPDKRFMFSDSRQVAYRARYVLQFVQAKQPNPEAAVIRALI